jgi:phosphopentomutase
MRNPKYHLYLTPNERRTVINSLIDLRNDLITQGKYTDIIDELLIKLTKAKVKVKEVLQWRLHTHSREIIYFPI